MRFLSFLFVFVLFFLSVSNVYSEDKVSKQDEVVVEKSVVSEEKNETTFKFINTYDWSTITTLIVILVQFVGFGVSLFLLNRHFEKQRDIDKENHQHLVKMDFYKTFISQIDNLDFIDIGFSIREHFEKLREHQQNTKFSESGNLIINGLIDDKGKTDESFKEKIYDIYKLCKFLNHYSVISPHIITFNKFILIKIRFHRKNYYKLSMSISKILHSITKKPKDDELMEEIDDLSKLINSFNRDSTQIENWIDDVQNEIKNELLAEIFDREKHCRTQGDTEFILTSTIPEMIRSVEDYVGDNFSVNTN